MKSSTISGSGSGSSSSSSRHNSTLINVLGCEKKQGVSRSISKVSSVEASHETGEERAPTVYSLCGELGEN